MSINKNPRITIDALKNSRFGKEVNKRIEELNKEFWSEATKRFHKQLESDNNHDTIINACISPFCPNGKCYENLNYAFISVEPLVELEVKNFDVLILNKIVCCICNFRKFIDNTAGFLKG